MLPVFILRGWNCLGGTANTASQAVVGSMSVPLLPQSPSQLTLFVNGQDGKSYTKTLPLTVTLPVCTVNTDGAIVRSGSNDVYAVVTTLTKGTEVNPDGMINSGDWVRLTFDQ